jgi:WD repeat and SOF domain-containing protein 1
MHFSTLEGMLSRLNLGRRCVKLVRLQISSVDCFAQVDSDQGSVVLSDLARFVLVHQYGGIYLDADTLFLRDWEELWGWRGAFAYRWSFHDKYNTAVLRMHAGSALGSFLFRTALRNGLDFHPMTVSKYLQDARLDKLLFRCPDALFDPAFLTAEKYQMDRPPSPEFNWFGHLFQTPERHSAAPQVVGFDGFFRGAWSYHWHNFWCAYLQLLVSKLT